MPGQAARVRSGQHLTSMGLTTSKPIEPAAKGLGRGDNSTFTDQAYAHYDTRQGFGSRAEWVSLAEKLAEGKGRYRYRGRRTRPSFSRSEDMRLMGLTEMPADAKGLVQAMRKRAMVLHPDHGGSEEAFKLMFAAYERLLRMY
jgi:hypothetical protein